MIRFLQVNEGKPIQVLAASEAMTRGGLVMKDFANDTVGKATAATGFALVDVSPEYFGVNAVITPSDAAFEAIAEDQQVLYVVAEPGERYAVTECDSGLTKGDKLVASGGKFVKATTGDYEWVYGGTYDDPTGLDMYIVECVSPATIAAGG